MGADPGVRTTEPTVTAAMWKQHYIEQFAKMCIEIAQEHERTAIQLRQLAAKTLAPPPGTRIELTPRADTIRFIQEVDHV